MVFLRLNPKDTTRATVAYSDIFDYPLTTKELNEWALIGSSTARKVAGIDYRNGFLCLTGRANLIKLRRQRRQWQKEKWVLARRAAGWFKIIPTVLLVGVTGALAMNNAKQDDDIDFFIIAAPGSIWITRLLISLCTEILGIRRKPFVAHVTNMVCLNMFVTPRGMGIPPAERDSFAAHEVLQMKPVWVRSRTYRKFLSANAWTQAYLPNAWKVRIKKHEPTMYPFPIIFVWIFRVFEFPAKIVQLIYMQRHRTSEIITDSVIRFHPNDARVWVKRKFAARLKALKVPLDKVFYAS
jgi:hypothetical protein